MEKQNIYTCVSARRDVCMFFSVELSRTEGESAFWRAMSHIVHGDIIKHRISCKKCWRYYLRKKKEAIQKAVVKNE